MNVVLKHLAGAVAAVLCATFFAASVAHAAPERWAALSLLGDRINYVTARMQTGTNVSPNLVQPVPMQEGVLDRLALRALNDAQVAGVPEVVLLGLRDPKMYALQDKLFAAEGQPMLDGLRKALSNSGVTHVLLLAKMRADARFPVGDGYIGIGSVEGLGFYVDRSTAVRRNETGVSDTGFLAPFAYYRLVLFDLGAGKVVAEEMVRTSAAHALASTGQVDPWQVLSAEQKVDELERLLKEGTGPALAKIVATRRG